jgi:hypothetical protein
MLESKANKSTKSTNQCGAYCIIVVPLMASSNSEQLK